MGWEGAKGASQDKPTTQYADNKNTQHYPVPLLSLCVFFSAVLAC
jgi:hypothetical protein